MEDELTEEVGRLAIERKLDRVAAYRQLQACSHMTEQLHGRSLDDYDVPEVYTDPVGPSEARVVRVQGGKNMCYIVDVVAQTHRRVLPPDLVDVPLLVLLYDQCSVGSAGDGFTDHLGKMMLMKYEKIHRLIRDLKMSLQHSCGGVLLKAQVYSSSLWNYHSKPFGSGYFGTQMQRALNVFLLRNTVDSPRFQKYLPRMSKELNMPCRTREEQEAIFGVVSELPTIRRRGELSKLGRWFSWNGAAEENLQYFSAFKMILEDFLDGPGKAIMDPDKAAVAFDDLSAAANAKTPYAAIQKLREEGGGMKFAYNLSATSLYNLCTIAAEGTRPCWDWYTENTKACKTPQHALKYAIKMATQWASDSHLTATLRHSLYHADTLRKCDVGDGTTSKQKVAMRRLCDLSWSIVAERVQSLAARHAVPPDSYAAILQGDHDIRHAVASDLLRDAQNGYWLERERLTDAIANELWRDCRPLQSKPVRLTFAFFERDGHESVAGRKLLQGCVQTLPDNKGVEELHHACKTDAKHNACKKQSPEHLQHVVLSSQVLEKHGLKHAAAVTKEDFRRNFKYRSTLSYSRKHHKACHHKLPKRWSRIMGAKYWRTTSEVEGRITASAWHWLQTVGPWQKPGCIPPLHQLDLGTGIGLARALFSRLLLPKMVFKCLENDSYWATLGRGKWGALAWPVDARAVDGTLQMSFACDKDAFAQWHHVLDVDAYQVIPYTEALVPYGIALQSRDAEPLAKAAMRKTGSLSCDDLLRLARHYQLIADVEPPRRELLGLLAHFLGGTDADFIEHVLKDLPPENSISLLAQDPFFELAFDDLDPDNKKELPDIKKALDRQKTRNHAVARQQKRKAEAKAKAVAKAKVAPPPAEPPPVLAPPAAPVDPLPLGPPPELALVPAAPAAPKAKAKAAPKALAYGGNYEYTEFAGGHIVFSDVLFKINAHCLHTDHQTDKCHLVNCLPWKLLFYIPAFRDF